MAMSISELQMGLVGAGGVVVVGIFAFNKVAGHTGIAGNERADELCALAFKKEAIA